LTVARDGVEALRAVRKPENYRWKRKPDLILLDLDIPQKNGKEVLCEIKSDPEMGKIPLLILANSKNNEDIQWVYEMGANFYIVKPLDQEYVRIIIEYIEKFWQLNLLSPGNSQTELSNPILWVVPPEGGFRRIKDLAYRIKNRWWKTN
jgi:CheY-like chemotaxis protein